MKETGSMNANMIIKYTMKMKVVFRGRDPTRLISENFYFKKLLLDFKVNTLSVLYCRFITFKNMSLFIIIIHLFKGKKL